MARSSRGDGARNLVVVESPAKAKTIQRYLGPEFRVLASYGHVRDLPENPGRGQLGVDIEHDFAPRYVVPPERRRQVEEIGRAARSAEAVWLATDLDREGEAIAWHVVEAAEIPPDKARRVTFSEITERAIREAFARPRQIDRHLVDAQQARRVVDRLVGYTLSPFLWRKVRRGLSAGRVQSVAVRLVVEREREIRAFHPEEYWTVEVELATASGSRFRAQVARIDGERPRIPTAEAAAEHAAALTGARPVVLRVTARRTTRLPAPPFTTSTLQQEASRRLGFSPQRTMRIAQRLYEGVETAEGQIGLITYMRTDSVAMAAVAQEEARAVIAERFGIPYTTPRGRVFRNRVRNAQEAHEAIRPTSFRRHPDSLEGQLDPEELRLYRLVWQRAIASQMAARALETTTVELEAGRYRLRATASRTLFDGFSRVYTEGRDEGEEEPEAELPPLREGDATDVVAVAPERHVTEPPPRYTEASLVKALEEHGIGRPSTYASIVATIIERGYVVVRERRLYPTILGEIVTDLLVGHFGPFVDVGFTARMEEDLDAVAQGRQPWVPLVRAFYEPFRSLVEAKERELRRTEITSLPTEERCSVGHPMVLRLGPRGPFLGCSLYPEHRETRPAPDVLADLLDEVARAPQEASPGAGEPCPVCGARHGGRLVERRSRFGPFLGCSRYPACQYVHRPPASVEREAIPTVPCPRCGEGRLVQRRARRSGSRFFGCSRYPACRYATSATPTGAVHDADEGPIGRRADGGGVCLACGANVVLPVDETPMALVGRRLPGGPGPEVADRRRGGGRRGRSTSAGPKVGGRPSSLAARRRAAG